MQIVDVPLWRKLLARSFEVMQTLDLKISLDTNLDRRLTDFRSSSSFVLYLHVHRLVMTDEFWWRDDRGRTSQHRRDLSLPISTAFYPISNVGCRSGVFVVLRYVIWVSRVRWQSCVKGAVECHLVFVMGIVLLGAFYVFQDVWVRHYLWIAVLIRDRVVVTN